MAAASGVGLSWSSSVSACPASSSRRSSRNSSSVVKMAISVEKKLYTLEKSEEIFNAAKVHFFHSFETLIYQFIWVYLLLSVITVVSSGSVCFAFQCGVLLVFITVGFTH